MNRSEPSPTPVGNEQSIPPSSLDLVVFVGDTTEAHPLPARGALSIGRSSDNDIRINHPSVSRRHAVLHIEAGLLLEDLGGVNGTYIHPPSGTSEADETRRSITLANVELGVGDHVTFGSVMSAIRRRSGQAPPRSTSDSRSAPPPREGIIISDPVMLDLYAKADLAAEHLISVLLLGETGVGKEVLARTIHLRSSRAAGPFLALNCAALSESLLESELFGHEKGAFTGATHTRPGLFESAEGGTVFLDEAGDLPMSVQVKLLRVLEERQVLRVGGRSPRPINVRFVAATNCDLQAKVAAGTFRQDLFYRLNGFPLTIPSLRERVGDIGPLADFFAAKECLRYEYSTVAVVTPQARAVLERYAWPGNVRELRNVIERAVVLGRGGEIHPAHLPTHLTEAPAPSSRPHMSERAPPGIGATQPIVMRVAKGSPEERAHIEAVLDACGGNQTVAATILGYSRRTLVSRLEEHSLPRPRKKV
ncbi:MAG: sigma 54-interacting transcriptional regulator [Byssovorax sp.]